MPRRRITPPNARMGWQYNPREVERVVATFEHPVFALAAVECMEQVSGDIKDTFFWEAEEKLFGQPLKAHRQTIGDCLPAGAMVYGETLKPIEQVKIGDRVWTGQGRWSRVISTQAKNTFNPVVEVSVTGGMPIRCTSDHKILVYRMQRVAGKRVTSAYYQRALDTSSTLSKSQRQEVVDCFEGRTPEWVKAEDLESTDYVLMPKNLENIPAKPEMPVSDWLFGYFLGDGCASGGSVEFAVSDDTKAKVLREKFAECGYDCKTGMSHGNIRIRIHSKSLFDWFRSVCYDDQKAKVMPIWAYGNAQIVEGLTSSDGFTRNGKRHFDSTSLSLAHGMFASLVLLGYEPTIKERQRGAGIGVYPNAKPLYRLTWLLTKQKQYSWSDKEYYCRPVRAVKYVEGPEVVYDIGVEDEHHSFIADGMVYSNCVSHGWGRGAQDLMFLQLAEGSTPRPPDMPDFDVIGSDGSETRIYGDKILHVATEPLYALSRVEIGGGRIGGDGSVGGWAAKAVKQYGILLRKAYGNYDLSVYSGQKARKWGRRGAGLPNELEPIAKEHPVKTCSLVTTDDEVIAALQNWYPIPVCSGQGFTTTRVQGWCKPRGSWAHCMVARGICTAKMGRNWEVGVVIQQSWGQSPGGDGRVELKSGRTIELPQGCFLITMGTFVRMLRQRDSFAISDLEGFKPRVPNFAH